MKVLIIDDDKLVVAALETILKADGDISVVGTGDRRPAGNRTVPQNKT